MRHTIAALLMMSVAVSGAPSAQEARLRIGEALEAMGGVNALQQFGPVRVDVIGHGYALEQSERPEGPWLASYSQRTETRDAARRHLVRRVQTRNWSAPDWSPTAPVLVVTDGIAARRAGERWLPGTSIDLAAAADAFDLAPERILLTARDAADLRLVPARSLQGNLNHGLRFSWHGQTLTLFLNGHTHLPTMLEIVRDDTFGIWGDVTERRWYSFWALEPGGVWYPRQVTTDWNGLPFSDETVLGLTPQASLDEADLAVPAEVRTAFTKGLERPIGFGAIHLDPMRAIEISPDVVMLPGSWNVLLVRQADGVVVIEAPISAQYSTEVIAYASRRFPRAAIKAVVTTSDAWPHIGGVREYVARGVPVYRLDLNGPILDRLVAAPRGLSPDALARSKRKPSWQTLAGRTVIGTGDTRVELMPVRGELGERMMFAWLPGPKLLYASDMVQRDRTGGFFWVGLLAEVEGVVRRERLETIERVAAMHLPPTPFAEITSAVAKIRGR